MAIDDAGRNLPTTGINGLGVIRNLDVLAYRRDLAFAEQQRCAFNDSCRAACPNRRIFEGNQLRLDGRLRSAKIPERIINRIQSLAFRLVSLSLFFFCLSIPPSLCRSFRRLSALCFPLLCSLCSLL